MKLQITSKEGRGKASHYHYAYFDEKTGAGITTIDNKHKHVVTFAMPTEPDPTTGAMGNPGGWYVEEENGHTHGLEDIVFKEAKLRSVKDEDLAQENRELLLQADSDEAKSRKEAEEDEKFTEGEQWNKADKDALEAADRAALTINEIEPKIDLLSGYQRQSRTDFRFLPVEGGDARVADILNVVVKQICSQNHYEYEETDAFEDMAIGGRGNLDCYLSYESDLRGDIVIERFNWKEAFYGPHAKKNASDCEYVIKARWYSKAKIEQLWPEKADKVQLDFTALSASTESLEVRGDAYNNPDTQMPVPTAVQFVNIAKKEYRLLEIQRKEYKRVPVLADEGNDFYLRLDGFNAGELKRVETLPDVVIVKKPETVIRKTIQAGNVILEDGVHDDIDFSLIPIYAKKRGTNWWGKVRPVKDAQKEINKRHSQSIDLMNRVAGYGWFYDNETFSTPQEMNDFKNNITKMGFNIKIADINRQPVLKEGVRFPGEITQMMELDSRKIKELMNVNTEMLGMGRASQSGVALIEQKRQGLVGNEFLFDNLSLSKVRLGKKIIRLIQKTYTPERILRIVANEHKKSPVSLGGKDLQEYSPEEIVEMLKNADLSKHDVSIAEGKMSATARMSNFLLWADLSGKGFPVPPSVIIDLSDLPEKDKVKTEIDKMNAQKAEAEKAKNNTEIEKVKIAHGIQATPPDTGRPQI